MLISDWSSDVCSSDLPGALAFNRTYQGEISKWSWSGRAVLQYQPTSTTMIYGGVTRGTKGGGFNSGAAEFYPLSEVKYKPETLTNYEIGVKASTRSEEHTSELQSLMRISYAVFCLKKKNIQ